MDFVTKQPCFRRTPALRFSATEPVRLLLLPFVFLFLLSVAELRLLLFPVTDLCLSLLSVTELRLLLFPATDPCLSLLSDIVSSLLSPEVTPGFPAAQNLTPRVSKMITEYTPDLCQRCKFGFSLSLQFIYTVSLYCITSYCVSSYASSDSFSKFSSTS